MSDKLTSRNGPIPPEHWDGQPSPVARTPAAEAQAQRDIAEIIARGKAVQAQLRQQQQQQAPPPPAQDAWNEAQHHRGQPGNAGEFGPGGGARKAAPATRRAPAARKAAPETVAPEDMIEGAEEMPHAKHDPSQAIYLRVGTWNPKNEQSHNYAKGDTEAGVSTYDLDDDGKPMQPTETEWPQDMEERLRGDDPKLVVQGQLVGQGGDGEPLLQKMRVVGEWTPEGLHLIGGGTPKKRADY